MKSEFIIKALVVQNQILLESNLQLIKIIADATNNGNNVKECNNHKNLEPLMKNLLNEDGIFDPFKGMDEEMKKGFANALKHAPDIISVIKKEQEAEEERNREWKEKLRGNK